MPKKKGTIPPLTDAEEAEIHRQIALNPDTDAMTDEQAAQATTFAKAFPELAEEIRKRREKR